MRAKKEERDFDDARRYAALQERNA